MKDQELLELAARAAGVDYEIVARSDMGLLIRMPNAPPNVSSFRVWNPLEADSAALRLAVACGISIRIDKDVGRVEAYTDDFGVTLYGVTLYLDKDEMAVVRRAIVRAAAELGSRSNVGGNRQ